MPNFADMAPANLMVVGFRGEKMAGSLLSTLAQLDTSGAIILGHVALLKREADGHVTARKEQRRTGETPASLPAIKANDQHPTDDPAMQSGRPVNDAVPVGLNDELIRQVATGMPRATSALIAIVILRDLAPVWQALAVYSAGKLLYQSLPSRVADELGELFLG